MHEPRGRVTLLVDFLADPDDETGFKTLLRWVDREARAGRLRQDPRLRAARRVPAGASQVRLLRGEVDDGVRDQGQRRGRAAGVLREHRSLARHARRFGSGSVDAPRLLVGIDTEGDNQWDAAARAHQRFENIYALPRLHALFARHGVRPTYVITLSGGDGSALGGGAAGAARGRRLRNRRASPRVGNAALHGRGRRAGIRMRRTCRCEQFEAAARGADRRDRARRWANGRCRIVRAGSAFRRRTSPHSSGWATASNRASRRSSTRRTRTGPDFVDAPLTPYFLAYDSATTAGHERRAGSAGVRRAQSALPAAAAASLRARAAHVHDEAGPEKARRRAGALAASVVFVARRHDCAGARPRARPASRC